MDVNKIANRRGEDKETDDQRRKRLLQEQKQGKGMQPHLADTGKSPAFWDSALYGMEGVRDRPGDHAIPMRASQFTHSLIFCYGILRSYMQSHAYRPTSRSPLASAECSRAANISASRRWAPKPSGT